jgi:predicted transcriptional regulator
LQRLLKLLITSEKRCKIILELSEAPKSLAELSKTLDIIPSNLLPYLRKLEYEELVKSKNGKYSLTESGKLVKELFFGLISGMNIIEEYRYFWNNHDISSIPNNLLKRIYELGNCAVVKNSSEDIYELHEEFIENVKLSNNIYGISPIYHPEYPLMFLKLAKTGKDINLILTESVL